MGNEILAMIEKDSLHMRCLHLCGEIYGKQQSDGSLNTSRVIACPEPA
jgi:hypothetical protein